MAKNRMVNTRFWDDAYISDLDPIEKLMFLYMLTNTSTNVSGVYEIPVKKIANETGLDKEMVQKIVKRFSRDKKIYYKDGWVAIRNFIKHQNQESPKVKKGIIDELEKAPQYIKDLLQLGHVEYEETPYISKRQSVLIRDNFACAYCSTEITDQTYELDHVVPKAKGGRDVYSNIVLACRSCNQDKGDKDCKAFCGEIKVGRDFHAEQALSMIASEPDILARFLKVYPDFSLDTETMKYPISTLSHLTKPNLTKPNLKEAPSAESEEQESLAPEVIKAFEVVDPKNKTNYGNKTQRAAADFLISEYGLEQVLSAIAVLPQTNAMPYMPSITTPYELKEKWVKLQDAMRRKKIELTKPKRVVLSTIK